MVHYFLDTWILKLYKVPQELWKNQDYDFNLLVLLLSSVKIIGKINMVEQICEGSKAFLAKKILFKRLILSGVIIQTLGLQNIFMFSWESMIWFTSFHNPLRKDNSLEK